MKTNWLLSESVNLIGRSMKKLPTARFLTCVRHKFNARIVLLAMSVWAAGYNASGKQVDNQAKPAAAPQNQTNTAPQTQTFKIYSVGMVGGGQISIAGFNSLLGNLKIDPNENKIYWQDHELLYLGKRDVRYSFFNSHSQQTVTFASQVDKDDKTLSMLFEDPRMISVGGIVTAARTKRGEGQPLADSLDRLLRFSKDVTGLLATTKYVDGNAVDLRSYEYAGNLKVDNNSCVFNNTAATVFTRQMSDGTRTLVVRGGTNELVLWPNGGWLLYARANVGVAFGGVEEGLETAYMKLREQAREFVPSTGHDEFNGIALANSPKATGTGFFITDDGYLISNYHVVKDATKVRLLTGAGLIDAKVVQVDAANDLALLKADGKFSPLPISSSRSAQLGGTVATVGFPDIGLQGFAPKLAKGEIASLSGAGDDPRYFQISAPVQPGNSGGALVDERGNVIGIVSAKLDAGAALAASGALPENVNYAVKSSLLLSFLESVPAVSAKLKTPVTADRKFEDVVKSAQDAAVLVLVY